MCTELRVPFIGKDLITIEWNFPNGLIIVHAAHIYM